MTLLSFHFVSGIWLLILSTFVCPIGHLKVEKIKNIRSPELRLVPIKIRIYLAEIRVYWGDWGEIRIYSAEIRVYWGD